MARAADGRREPPCNSQKSARRRGRGRANDIKCPSLDLAELPSLGRLVVRACRALGLAHVEELPGGRTRISNLTIINYALYKLGPMREDRLTAVLLAVQAACSAAALLVRYQLAGLLYDVVR